MLNMLNQFQRLDFNHRRINVKHSFNADLKRMLLRIQVNRNDDKSLKKRHFIILIECRLVLTSFLIIAIVNFLFAYYYYYFLASKSSYISDLLNSDSADLIPVNFKSFD